MDYKEKLKDIINSNKTPFVDIDTFLKYFPELAESEDERVRKELIEFVKSRGGFKQEYIAWLEKQGEQKPADKVESKFKVGDIIRHKEQGFTCKIIAVDTEYRLSGCNGNHLPFDWQDAYELVEQKSAEWSEEGKQNLKIEGYENLSDYEKIFDDIADKYVRNKNQKGYNQSWYVKERAAEMLYQANKELKKKASWSEEDEKMIDAIYSCVDSHYDGLAKDALLIWLKSLKDRYTWKPSDRQMNVLEYYMHTLACNEHKEILFGLYQDLKKLKE